MQVYGILFALIDKKITGGSMKLRYVVFVFLLFIPAYLQGYPFDIVEKVVPNAGSVSGYFSSVTIYEGGIVAGSKDEVVIIKNGKIIYKRKFAGIRICGVASGGEELLVAGMDKNGVGWFYRFSQNFSEGVPVAVGIEDLAFYANRFWAIDKYGEVITLTNNAHFYQSIPGSWRFIQTGGQFYTLSYFNSGTSEDSIIYRYENNKWVEVGHSKGKLLDLLKVNGYFYALIVSGAAKKLSLFKTPDLDKWSFLLNGGFGENGVLVTMHNEIGLIKKGSIYIHLSGNWEINTFPSYYKFYRSMIVGNRTYLVGGFEDKVGIIGKIDKVLNIIYPSEIVISQFGFQQPFKYSENSKVRGYPIEVYSFKATSFGLRFFSNQFLLLQNDFLPVTGYFIDFNHFWELGYEPTNFFSGRITSVARYIWYRFNDNSVKQKVEKQVQNDNLKISLCSSALMFNGEDDGSPASIPVLYEYNGTKVGIWGPGKMKDLSAYGVSRIKAIGCAVSEYLEYGRKGSKSVYIGVVNEDNENSRLRLIVLHYYSSSGSFSRFRSLLLPYDFGDGRTVRLVGGNGKFFLYDGRSRLGIVSGPFFDRIRWVNLPEKVTNIISNEKNCLFGFAVNAVYFACGNYFIFSNEGELWHIKETEYTGKMKGIFSPSILWGGRWLYFVSPEGELYATVMDPIGYIHSYSIVMYAYESLHYSLWGPGGDLNEIVYCFDFRLSGNSGYQKIELTNNGKPCFTTKENCIYISARECAGKRIWGGVHYFFKKGGGAIEEYVAPVSMVVYYFPRERASDDFLYTGSESPGCGCKVGGSSRGDVVLLILLISGVMFILKRSGKNF